MDTCEPFRHDFIDGYEELLNAGWKLQYTEVANDKDGKVSKYLEIWSKPTTDILSKIDVYDDDVVLQYLCNQSEIHIERDEGLSLSDLILFTKRLADLDKKARIAHE